MEVSLGVCATYGGGNNVVKHIMDLQCGKQRQMVERAVYCSVLCVCEFGHGHTHTYTLPSKNACGEEVPKAHYECCRSLTQAKGLSSFGF